MYYIDSDGQRVHGKIFVCGSGSTYALGVLDKEYREDLTEEEACELARKSIYHAQHRDTGTGGLMNVVIVDKNGLRWITRKDGFESFYKYINDPAPFPLEDN